MDFERTIETQRLKLLRIVAGLVVAVGVLAVGPVSRGFSVWVCGFVGSILSRAEAAARYLVIAQARWMMTRSGMDLDRSRLSELLDCAFDPNETDVSVSDFRKRLNALRGVLIDLPRHAARLIHRIQKYMRRAIRAGRLLPRIEQGTSASFCAWRLGDNRIERPPDKAGFCGAVFPPSLRTPAGGVGG